MRITDNNQFRTHEIAQNRHFLRYNGLAFRHKHLHCTQKRLLMLPLLSFLLLTAAALPDGGTPVLPANPLGTLQEVNQTQYGSFNRIAADQETARRLNVTEVLRCTTTAKPASPWGFRIQFSVGRDIKKNEVLLLRFQARTIEAKTESGSGIVQSVFEKARPPYLKSLERRIEISREWKEYTLPFRAADSYAAKECTININLGFQEQTIEITDLMLYSYGADFDIKTIPDSIPKYKGQEPDAAWRQEAEKRIEQIRKGDLRIVVTRANGQAISDAKVEIRMKRHAFGWGSAVVARRILQQGEDSNRYREIVEKYFNRVVFENDLKWYSWQNAANRDNVVKAVQWLEERDIDVRGHCLIWASWRNTPRYLKDWENDPEKIRQHIREHIQEEVTALKGKIYDWDVVNELYANNDVTKLLGDEEIVKWFQIAKEADPKPNLYINDYGILSAEGRDTRHQNSYAQTIQFLLDNKAPLGGIGLQSHFGSQATPPEKMLEILDRFGKFGLPISITEHDINTDDEAFQADFTRDFLTVAFSHPSVEAILTWGFWERSHWLPKGAYYRADWSLKPAGQVWLDLVTKKWWSNFDEKTNAKGEVAVRGFLGDYEITVRKGGQAKTVKAAIPKEGKRLDITLE